MPTEQRTAADDATLAKMHADDREASIRAAFAALSGLAKCDRQLVIKWARDRRIEEALLRSIMDDYRCLLERTYQSYRTQEAPSCTT